MVVVVAYVNQYINIRMTNQLDVLLSKITKIYVAKLILPPLGLS